MPASAVSLVATSLLAFSSLAAAAKEFSVARLGDGVFAIVRNDPPGFAVESNSGFIECRDQIVRRNDAKPLKSTAAAAISAICAGSSRAIVRFTRTCLTRTSRDRR